MTLTRDLPLIPAQSALLFIDVQNFSAHRKGAEFDGLDPAEFDAKYGWYFDQLDSRVIPNMQAVQAACRAAGVEVMYTTIESLTLDGRDRSLDYKITGFNVPKGSWDGKVIDQIAPEGDEIVLTKSVQNDEGLIRYLMRHWHSTPFEMCELKLHVKLPVFVARQWIRHRTANVNEYSARYSILDREFYIPAPEHVAAQSAVNNQGRGEALQGEEAARVLEILKADSARCYDNYEAMIGQEGQQGLARELARMNLPANIYTQWYWKVDLHNLFHFLRLRADAHAQYEIRVYAETMCRLVADWVPFAYKAFEDYRLGAVNLSAQMVDSLRRMLAGEAVTQETSGLSAREWREFQDVIGR